MADNAPILVIVPPRTAAGSRSGWGLHANWPLTHWSSHWTR